MANAISVGIDGRRIRRERLRRGLSQRALGKMIGRVERTVTTAEKTGKTSFATASALCKFLELDWNQLVITEDSIRNADSDEQIPSELQKYILDGDAESDPEKAIQAIQEIMKLARVNQQVLIEARIGSIHFTAKMTLKDKRRLHVFAESILGSNNLQNADNELVLTDEVLETIRKRVSSKTTATFAFNRNEIHKNDPEMRSAAAKLSVSVSKLARRLKASAPSELGWRLVATVHAFDDGFFSVHVQPRQKGSELRSKRNKEPKEQTSSQDRIRTRRSLMKRTGKKKTTSAEGNQAARAGLRFRKKGKRVRNCEGVAINGEVASVKRRMRFAALKKRKAMAADRRLETAE